MKKTEIKRLPLLLFVTAIFIWFSITNPLNAQPPDAASTSPNLLTGVEDVAKQVGPAVVSVRTERIERTRAYRRTTPAHPYYEDFFNQFFEEYFGGTPQYERRFAGVGSGVIIDPKGYILTNEHVVRGSDKITIALADGRSFPGVLAGTDPRSDLAVIKIDAPELPIARLGSSADLNIGQWVVAIGNPFGHIINDPQPTVTAGVISALHRSLPQTSRRDTDYSDLIQTDAAINPGNSGGPLVNLNGEVVGINVAIFSTSGGYQGIGFAIPANYANNIVQQLIEGNEVVYGWIGVSIQDIDYRLARYFDLPTNEGVLIVKVLPDSPAEKAGITAGDIILNADQIKIRNGVALVKYIGNATIGKSIKLKILRDGKSKTISVSIGKRPSFNEFGHIEQDDGPLDPVISRPWRGITIENLSPDLAAQLDLNVTKGVIITQLDVNSPASDAGLRQGDVILKINKVTVDDTTTFNKITKAVKGSVLVHTQRGYFVIED